MFNFQVIVLCIFLCAIFDNCKATIYLNLSSICAEQQQFYCTIDNVTIRYDATIMLAKSTQPDLQELIIQNSQIRRIPYNLFIQTPNLTTLLIDKCGIIRLYTEDFNGADHLQRLVLQRNNFFSLHENTFINSPALVQLHLPQNTINMLHAKAFARLHKLRYLDLQQNSINLLPDTLFGELTNLEHIDLSNNNIAAIDESTFAQNSQLHTVILANNKFTVFQPRALEHLPHLHLLDISHCIVDTLNLQTIDTLLASFSNLSMCSIQQGGLKLQLSNNQLAFDGFQVSNKLAVRDLDIHANQLTTLDALVGMINLQRLDVSKNQLTNLNLQDSSQFLPLPSLTYLNLASNLLRNLNSRQFLLLTKLTYLDLAFNRLQQIDVSIFEPLVNLEKLYLEGNHLHSLEYTLMLQNHPVLLEVGLFDNEFDLKYMRKMLAYLRDRHVILPVRFIAATSNDGTLRGETASSAVAQAQSNSLMPMLQEVDNKHAEEQRSLLGVTGIHPYWTKKDAMTMLILVFVFIILLINMYRLLQDEPCLLNCCRNMTMRTRGSQNRPRPLSEEETEGYDDFQ